MDVDSKLSLETAKNYLFGAQLEDGHPLCQLLTKELAFEEFLFAFWDQQTDLDKNVLPDLATEALEYFLQANYTGPYLPDEPVDWLPQAVRSHPDLKNATLNALTVDGERPYHLAPKLLLLVFSRALFSYAKSQTPIHLWNEARLAFLLQRILQEHVASLHNLINKNMSSISDYIVTQDQDVQGRYAIELGLIHSFYGRDGLALRLLNDAGNVMDFAYELTGALGRRTKFQTFDASQLVVLAKSRNREGGDITATQPRTLELNDDTLLEKISFKHDQERLAYREEVDPRLKEENPNEPSRLHPLDAALLLAYCQIIKNSNPDDGLTREEMSPYAERVLAHPVNWSVYTMGLLIRTRLEGFKSRTVERSVLQLQVLVDQLNDQLRAPGTETVDSGLEAVVGGSFLPKPKDEGESASLHERLAYAHQLSMPSRWQLEDELAKKFMSIGSIRSALEIYERLEMWDCVALCHCSLERTDLAINVIRTQLEKDPNDHRLRTMLGDIENDISHYEKAWELSGCRYAPAQRALGRHYYAVHDMKKCMESFEKSLRINPLSYPTWFTYGCAALELNAFEVAMEAFTRCLSIDPEDGESWNNLASAMLKAKPKNKRDAWRTLQQGLRFMYENWRVWENYMLVSVDVGEWSEVIRAMRRIIELRSKSKGETAVDVQCLDLLVNHVTQHCKDDTDILARLLTELFAIIIPLITNDVRLWKLVARFMFWRQRWAESLDATLKAYRVLLSSPNITSELAVWDKTVDGALDVVDAYTNLGEKPGRMGGVVAKDWKFKSRSVLRSLMGRGKGIWEETESYQKLQKAMEDLKSQS
ncbi:TTC27 family TPR repeat protein [Schizosaccharomyces japonicus yFS275]|uniref:TTC27 family TPR repeat protein n=1 Tax=Schizosaccharomyces japonicus (strain yFS275 / FY16936) TaxID=402676 RepID=B6K098_SCHJY|nr:TTC27 family TPR repeat protein [Schizosaccharomyces japonicus yFS275]EEB06248.1 TTC27 family TPR repeat protein [Schizosaccharomyces japonicus yFS275]